jgi:hypothetical protein
MFEYLIVVNYNGVLRVITQDEFENAAADKVVYNEWFEFPDMETFMNELLDAQRKNNAT